MGATELAIGILVKMSDKGRFFNLQATEDDFCDAKELVAAFHEAYKAGIREATANEHEKQDAERGEADREKRQIAVEVQSALRRDVPDVVASLLRVLIMHGITPPGGDYTVPVPEEPETGVLGLRTDLVPADFQADLSQAIEKGTSMADFSQKAFPNPEWDREVEGVAFQAQLKPALIVDHNHKFVDQPRD